MKKTATTRYDVAEHLRTPEEMAAYLEASLEEAGDDAAFVAKALGDIARAKGMSQVARDAGLSRESLYKALSGDRSPQFCTILKVVAALGLKLHAEAEHAAGHSARLSAGVSARTSATPSFGPSQILQCRKVSIMAEDYRYQPEHLSEDDKELVHQISDALLQGRHEEGLASLRKRLEADPSQEPKAYAELRFLLGGFLIDYGGDMGRPELIEEGVEVFETDREGIADLEGNYTVEYCLGNAKYSLHGHAVRNSQIEFKPENLKLLVEAKNHHWRAVKELEESGHKLQPHILINLGNALDTSGRVIEAIRNYDRALEIDAEFGMAHLNRGMALFTLNQMSDTYTINMLLQQEQHFEVAMRDERLAKHNRERARAYLKAIRKKLESHDVTETLEEHGEHIAAEVAAAPPFRLFCIANKLALNEHALYCQCKGAQSDNLRIPKSTAPIGGDFVPAMELLLNRIRAEFGLARMLYYRYTNNPMETEEYEPEYSELFDNERLGLNVELLRTSFRLCFGILDRIAFAVCTLFDLAGEKERIYFEGFWEKPKPKTKKEKERWEKINDARNWGLTALYSQATDLNVRSGEWRHYKGWRNRLEHEALILTATDGLNVGPWVKQAAGERLESVNIEIFRKETLHLLQITTAAIFYFTYCVRQEGTKAHTGHGITTAIEKRERDAP